jgi:hypothetical protein
MSIISKIKLPDNTVYDIKTGDPYLDTSYNVTSKTVTLFNSVNNPGYVNLIRFSEEISSDKFMRLMINNIISRL